MVSIIIVNYNTCKLTSECINSIYEKVHSCKYEIIVVDNASVDNSAAAIKRKYPEVILITSRKNLGFGRANNLGAKYAKGEYLFLLNSDTVLNNDPFPYFIDFSEKHNKKLGAIGTYLRDGQGEYSKCGGTFYSISKYLITALKKWFLLSSKEEVPFQKRDVPVDYVIGADLFIRRELFEELEGFDKHIFMYFEDVELCKRLSDAGYQSYIIYGPDITHFVKASSTSQFPRVYNTASLVYCLQKEESAFQLKIFQFCLFVLKLPLLFQLKRLKENTEYISAIFNYKKYILS